MSNIPNPWIKKAEIIGAAILVVDEVLAIPYKTALRERTLKLARSRALTLSMRLNQFRSLLETLADKEGK
jgi:hypothetical protein